MATASICPRKAKKVLQSKKRHGFFPAADKCAQQRYSPEGKEAVWAANWLARNGSDALRRHKKNWKAAECHTLFDMYLRGCSLYAIIKELKRSFRSIDTKLWKLAAAYMPPYPMPLPGERFNRSDDPMTARDHEVIMYASRYSEKYGTTITVAYVAALLGRSTASFRKWVTQQQLWAKQHKFVIEPRPNLTPEQKLFRLLDKLMAARIKNSPEMSSCEKARLEEEWEKHQTQTIPTEG